MRLVGEGNKIRRVAASRVYVSPTDCRINHIVELVGDEVTAVYPLVEELPATEWLGGTIVLRPSQPPDERVHADYIGMDMACSSPHN